MEHAEKCREKAKNPRLKDSWAGEDGLSPGKAGSPEDRSKGKVKNVFYLLPDVRTVKILCMTF